MLEKELTGEPALSLWESYYLLAVSNTGCQLSIKKRKKKKKKSSQALHSAALHCPGERREIINGMLWPNIWLGPSRKFPFGKPALGAWAAGTQEPHFVGYSASCAGKPTQSWRLAPATDDFPWATGTEQKTVENGEWVAQFLLLELIINWCTPQLQFGYCPQTLQVLIRLHYSCFHMSLSGPFHYRSWFTSK